MQRSTAECGGMRVLSSAGWDSKNPDSASGLRAARYGEIRGEIWGDLPLLGSPAAVSPSLSWKPGSAAHGYLPKPPSTSRLIAPSERSSLTSFSILPREKENTHEKRKARAPP